MKHVLAVTGSPADWGLLDSVLQHMLGRIRLTLVVIGNHDVGALYEYSDNVDLVMSSSLEAFDMKGQAAQSIVFAARVFEESRDVDAILMLGDRVEVAAFAVVARLQNIPIHHLYAGDRSGCVDDYYRDAISVMANHLYVVSHFSLCRGFDLKRATENRIESVDLVAPEMVVDESLLPDKPYALARWHPETLRDEPVVGWMRNALEMARKDGVLLYIFPPNRDDGWQEIDGEITLLAERFPQTVRPINGLTRPQYLGMLKNAVWIRGNSSSFFLEAPMLGCKVLISDGNRQTGRVSPDVGYNSPLMADQVLKRLYE